MRRFFSLCLAAALLAILAPPASAFDYRRLADRALERHIRPGYARLETAFNDLGAALNAYCEAPGAADADALYDGYRRAAIAWGKVEHIGFGPVSEHHRRERIAFWPDARALGRRQVLKVLRKEDAGAADPARLAGKSVALQGLTALEVILYEKSGRPRFTGAGPGRFACAYGRAITANLRRMAAKMNRQWQPAGTYGRLWARPGPDNPLYLNDKEIVQELMQTFAAAAELIRDKKLLHPMGRLPGRPNPSTSPFMRSRLSLAMLRANVEGLESLYADGGFLEAVNEFRAGQGKSISDLFDISLTILGRLQDRPVEPFSSPAMWKPLMPVTFLMRDIREQGVPMIGEASDLSLGFNASDGD